MGGRGGQLEDRMLALNRFLFLFPVLSHSVREENWAARPRERHSCSCSAAAGRGNRRRNKEGKRLRLEIER